MDLDGFEAEIERVFFGGVELEDLDAEDAALTAVCRRHRPRYNRSPHCPKI